MDLTDWLIRQDKALFLRINGKWHHPALDLLFQHIRETYCWMPLYLFFLVMAVMNFGKRGWWWILAAILTISITDQLSSNLIKHAILRLRPCRDPMLADHIRFFVRYCPASSSFTSSHATNHFGFAVFVIFTLRKYSQPWIYLLLLAAAAVSYAQVYVGVHFPLDVFCGGLIGAFTGYGMSVIFNKKIGLSGIQAN